ncbi:MAG: hypothetical protein ABI700_20520, partial [Chloroflexota bacterium]
EEVYGENGWIAQHEVRLDGTFAQTIDEQDGMNEILHPLELPTRIVKPKTGWHTMALNFAGPRHRGLRAPERIADLVRMLSIDEKMAVIAKFKLDIIPPMLLGIAESYVLAEAELQRPNLYFVCRRIRLAVALPETRMDEDNQPYDYETRVIYVAHFYDCEQEPPFIELMADVTPVPLIRPMDCLLHNEQLCIADGGSADNDGRLSAIHLWQVERPEPPTEAEKLNKKIYG